MPSYQTDNNSNVDRSFNEVLKILYNESDSDEEFFSMSENKNMSTSVLRPLRNGRIISDKGMLGNPLAVFNHNYCYLVYHYTDDELEIIVINPYDATKGYRCFTKEISVTKMLVFLEDRSDDSVRLISTDAGTFIDIHGILKLKTTDLTVPEAVAAMGEYNVRRGQLCEFEITSHIKRYNEAHSGGGKKKEGEGDKDIDSEAVLRSLLNSLHLRELTQAAEAKAKATSEKTKKPQKEEGVRTDKHFNPNDVD